MSRALPILTTSGRPEFQGLEGAIRDMGTQLHQNSEAAATEAESYAATPSSWASPAPTTQDEAITRIAAAVRTLLGSPIP